MYHNMHTCIVHTINLKGDDVPLVPCHQLIGASRSEPHTSESNGDFLCMVVMYASVTSRSQTTLGTSLRHYVHSLDKNNAYTWPLVHDRSITYHASSTVPLRSLLGVWIVPVLPPQDRNNHGKAGKIACSVEESARGPAALQRQRSKEKND